MNTQTSPYDSCRQLTRPEILVALFGQNVPSTAKAWLALPDALTYDERTPFNKQLDNAYEESLELDLYGIVGPIEWLVGLFAKLQAEARAERWPNLMYLVVLDRADRGILPLLVAQLAALQRRVALRVVRVTDNYQPIGVVDADSPLELLFLPGLCDELAFFPLSHQSYSACVGHDSLRLGETYEVLWRPPRQLVAPAAPLRIQITGLLPVRFVRVLGMRSGDSHRLARTLTTQ